MFGSTLFGCDRGSGAQPGEQMWTGATEVENYYELDTRRREGEFGCDNLKHAPKGPSTRPLSRKGEVPVRVWRFATPPKHDAVLLKYCRVTS